VTGSEVFWDIMQRRVIIPCRHFGTDVLRCVISQKIGDLIYVAAKA